MQMSAPTQREIIEFSRKLVYPEGNVGGLHAENQGNHNLNVMSMTSIQPRQ